LKLWDPVVFGTELKPTLKNQSHAANDTKLKKPANKKPAVGALSELLDDTDRPVQKVALIF